MPMVEEVVNTVSDAEIEILQHLWIESPMSAQEIIEKLLSKPAATLVLSRLLLIAC